MERRSSDEREICAARNQAMFRAVNEKMRELQEAFEVLVGTTAVACECAQVDCVQLLEVPTSAYEDVRRSPRTFVVRTEHVDPEVERVVTMQDGYAVVEAIGLGAQIAETTFRGLERPSVSDG
jgi:hypothetical protein